MVLVCNNTYCGQMIGKITHLSLFHTSFFQVIFTVNIIYQIHKKYANKTPFSQIYPTKFKLNLAIGNFYLPITLKLIARATNNRPQRPPKSTCSDLKFSVICAICTNRTQASLFFALIGILFPFFALFLPFITFYYIFFETRFCHFKYRKVPMEACLP